MSQLENRIKAERENLPKHIAFIMDGNGRWAQQRKMPRSFGHNAGLDAMRRVIRFYGEVGIKVLSFYAFSTENWKRSQREVNFLMNLPIDFIEQDLPELMERGARLIYSGDLTKIPKKTLDAMRRGEKATAQNNDLIINIAFNYGGRDEIIRGIRAMALEHKEGFLQALNEEDLGKFLDHPELPDPDLIVRTGGEQRLSNFFLWQAAYSELFFTEEYWPDLNEELLEKILGDYLDRNRRFGGL